MIDYGDYIRMRTSMENTSSVAEGYPCSLINSNGKHLLNYWVYGNSLQKGTPTSLSPADITSVGDLVTDKNDVHYGKYKIPIVVYGKNFLNCNLLADAYIPGVIMNKDHSITVNAGQNTFSQAVNIRTSKSYSIPTDNITITASCKNISNEIKMIVRTWSVGSTSSNYYTITSNSKSFTLSKGDVIQIFLQIPANGIVSKTTTLYPQLELGNTATEYEPYIKPVITDIYLAEPLRKIGNYYDYIDFKRQVVVRNIKQYSISKTIEWNDWKANGNRIMIWETLDKLYGNGTTSLGYFNIGNVKQLLWNDDGILTKTNTLYATSSSSSCYWYPDYTQMGLDGSEDIATANELLQNWLKSMDNIYFTYVLAKPKETKISLPVMPSKKGNVFIATNTSLPASNISAKYSTK